MQIKEDLGSIKSDISNISESVSAHINKDDSIHEDQEERITKLEDQQKKVKWMAVGAGAVIAGAWRIVEALIGSGGHH